MESFQEQDNNISPNSPAFQQCLEDLKLTNLSEPVIKFIQFKAKCYLNKVKDQNEWEDYCKKNNINIARTICVKKDPSLIQKEENLKPMIAYQKSIPTYYQTTQMKNKKVQTKTKNVHSLAASCKNTVPVHGKKNTVAQGRPAFKTERISKTRDVTSKKDTVIVSPTMMKLEKAVLEELVEDLGQEMESIEFKRKESEIKAKEKKLKILRRKIQELRDSLETDSESTRSEIVPIRNEKPNDASNEAVCLPMPEVKAKQILGYRDIPLYRWNTRLSGDISQLCEEASNELLDEILESVTNEIVEILDYVAAVSYQEELEIFQV